MGSMGVTPAMTEAAAETAGIAEVETVEAEIAAAVAEIERMNGAGSSWSWTKQKNLPARNTGVSNTGKYADNPVRGCFLYE